MFYQVTATLSISLVSRPLINLIERLQPPGEEETLTRPLHLLDDALDTPDVALELVTMEQARMVSHLVGALDNLRPDMAHRTELPHHSLFLAATETLGEEIQGYLSALIDQQPSRDTLEAAVVSQHRASLLLDLRATVADMIAALESKGHRTPDVAPLAHTLMESLHLTLGLLAEDMANGNPDERETLLTMTMDRSAMMERIRRTTLQNSAHMDLTTRELLFSTTALFERAQWLIHRCAHLPRPGEDTPPMTISNK